MRTTRILDRVLYVLLAVIGLWFAVDLFISADGPKYYAKHPLHLLCIGIYVLPGLLVVVLTRSRRGDEIVR